MTLDGKVALITGGTRGIGRGIALALAGTLAVSLASAPNVTGQAINVDGGMELH